MQLDSLDKHIIIALEHDGRRPYRDIARDLNTPEATIRSRVNRLIEEGLIHITAIGDPQKLGVHINAISLIKVQPGGIKETADLLKEFPNVRFVGTSLGSADIIIQTLHSSLQELHEFISETIPKIAPAVSSTETFQIAEVKKSSWEWRAWFEEKDKGEKNAQLQNTP